MNPDKAEQAEQATGTAWRKSALQLERDAYRRRQRRRANTIAAISTVVVFGTVYLVVTSSTGWDRTKASFFNPSTGWTDVPAQLRAVWVNIQIFLIAEVFILVFAGLLAVMRTLQGPVFLPLRVFATVYVDVFRGLPTAVGPLDLSRVVETSDVSLDSLPSYLRDRVAGSIHADSLAAARSQVQQLAGETVAPTPVPTFSPGPRPTFTLGPAPTLSVEPSPASSG